MDKVMETVIHRAQTRGHANHGWLDTNHTFSFSSYFNPERMGFGVLRVLNDDMIEGGTGFGRHPHDNMEIISIPLMGALEHRDSTGNSYVINTGDVQIMSAGTGIFHSEMNHLKDEKTNFLQIWVMPKKRNIEPRYDQKTFSADDRVNKWQFVVSPDEDSREGTVNINQDAYFSLTKLDAGKNISYELQKSDNIMYLFVLEGRVKLDGTELYRRDGIGIIDSEGFELEATENSELLLMEIPAQ